MTKPRPDLDSNALMDDKPVLRPPRTQTQKSRWIKPVLLTSLVYLVIGGLIYFTTSSSDTPTQTHASPIAPVRTIIPALTADEVASTSTSDTQVSPSIQNSPQTNNSQVGNPQAGSPQTDRALFNSPPIVNSTQANTRADLPISTPTVMPNDVSTMPNDYTSAPMDSSLSEAIDDSDAHNDSLRSAINQARQINDEKISQAISRPHLSASDSQVNQSPAYGADSTDNTGNTDSSDNSLQPEDTPKAP